MTPAVRAIAAVACSLVVGRATMGCSPGSRDAQTTEAPGPFVSPERAGSDAEVASPDFASCSVDSDCIAVPGSGCCGPGAWAAVNRSHADEYASAACTGRMPSCPQIILVGPRVPECDNGTHTCTIIAVSSIACGGFVRNTHHCPQDYLCEHRNRIADIPGVCVTIADAQPPE
jgi:hypothetical protein